MWKDPSNISAMIPIKIFREVELIVFDFDGVFTDNTVYIDQNGIESVRCWRSDGLGVSKLRQIGIRLYIISTEKNPVVSVRAHKLKIDCLQGVENKQVAIEKVCKELNIKLSQTMFVGNDINDIPAFKAVGIPVAVADAYNDVDKYIVYKTQRPGGFGAVREVCDLIAKAKTENKME